MMIYFLVFLGFSGYGRIKSVYAHTHTHGHIILDTSTFWVPHTSHHPRYMHTRRSRTALDALTRVRQRFAKMQLGGMTPEFLRYVASAFDFVPSLGMMGIVLGLQRCHRVTLYGFHVSLCAYNEGRNLDPGFGIINRLP